MSAFECDRLLEAAADLLRQGEPRAALESVRHAQKELDGFPTPDVVRLAQIACRLVDAGGDLRDRHVTREGLEIFVHHYDAIGQVTHPGALEYNLGNAKKTLYDIGRETEAARFTPASIALLNEAKNHYWRAIRMTDDDVPPEWLINLANALDQCGRVIEALLWYDRALELAPTFGMAHLNRGQALLFLNQLSDTYTISLLAEAKRAFRLAETSGDLRPTLVERARAYRRQIKSSLDQLGWDNERISSYQDRHRAEYERHDAYWRFCLSNHLALSEHSLYCQCAGARRDDLAIPKQSGPIAGDFVPRLELLLNRIKSEFCLARALYFQSIPPGEAWNTFPFEGTFSELYEGEAIGLEAEFLRTSFRLCFGILDRIALGLNELFRLGRPTEALYFESFWRPPEQRKRGKEERWDLINRQDNMALVALYSLATDLNRRGGEWGCFKEWRNTLEHGLLIMQAGEERLPAMVEPRGIAFHTVPLAEFRERTLSILQFTASAIFSFVFCVRDEGLRAPSGPAVTVEMSKKDIGKE